MNKYEVQIQSDSTRATYFTHDLDDAIRFMEWWLENNPTGTATIRTPSQRSAPCASRLNGEPPC